MISSISQVISKRIDQTRSILFLIGQRKDSLAEQVIGHVHAASAVQAHSGVGHLEDTAPTFLFAIRSRSLCSDKKVEKNANINE